jgi:hypothetical protein
MSRTPSTSSTGSQKAKKAPKTPKVGEMGELIEEDEGKKDTIQVKFPSSKKFKSLDLPGIMRSFGKKSDKLDSEKAKSADGTGPEISATSPIDVTAASVAVAAGVAAVATTAAVSVATEKQGTNVNEDLSTSPEVVAESSEPVLAFTDDAPKQDAVPVEVEVAVLDVEKTDIATTHTAVPEQDAQNVDAGAAAEPAIVSEPDSTIVADQRSHQPLPTVVEVPVQQHGDNEQCVFIPCGVLIF